MVADAERYKSEDDAAGKRIQAKNQLESYTYNLRNTLNDSKFADKIEAGDKTKLDAAINETVSWLGQNGESEKEQYEVKQKELEKIANPIMAKVYQAGGVPPGGMPGAGGGGPGADDDGGSSGGSSSSSGGSSGGSRKGPTVEEVD